jgi:hypothetical protein
MDSRSAPMRLLAATFLLIGLAASNARAETPAEACDKLAAHPADPAKPANIEGIATGSIEVDIAIMAQHSGSSRPPRMPAMLPPRARSAISTMEDLEHRSTRPGPSRSIARHPTAMSVLLRIISG